MSIINYLQEKLNTYPFITPEEFANLKSSLQKVVMHLSRIKTLQATTFTRRDNDRLKSLILLEEICKNLTINSKQNLINLIRSNTNIDEKTLLIFNADYVEDLLSEESAPLNIIANLNYNFSPLEFTALILALIRKKISIQAILKSGILHEYFIVNCCVMNEVEEAYRLLALIDSECEDYEKIQRLLNMVNVFSSNDCDTKKYKLSTFENYSLSGKLIKPPKLYFHYKTQNDEDLEWFSFDNSGLFYGYCKQSLVTSIAYRPAHTFLEELKKQEGEYLQLTYEQTKKLKELSGLNKKISILMHPFVFNGTLQNLKNLYQLFGIDFLLKVLLNNSPHELVWTFINETLSFENIREIYSYILFNLKEKEKIKIATILGEILNKNQIFETLLPINKLSWLILAGDPRLLGKLSKDQLKDLAQFPLNNINLPLAISVYDRDSSRNYSLFPVEKELFLNFFNCMLTYPERNNDEDDLFYDISIILSEYSESKIWCKKQITILESKLNEIILENAHPFTYNGYLYIYTFFCQNASKLETIRKIHKNTHGYPSTTHELNAYILNILASKGEVNLNQFLEAIHPQERYNYSTEEILQLKATTLCECISAAKNHNLRKSIISFLFNNFEPEHWQNFFDNSHLVFNQDFLSICKEITENMTVELMQAMATEKYPEFVKVFDKLRNKFEIIANISNINNFVFDSPDFFINCCRTDQFTAIRLIVDYVKPTSYPECFRNFVLEILRKDNNFPNQNFILFEFDILKMFSPEQKLELLQLKDSHGNTLLHYMHLFSLQQVQKIPNLLEQLPKKSVARLLQVTNKHDISILKNMYYELNPTNFVICINYLNQDEILKFLMQKDGFSMIYEVLEDEHLSFFLQHIHPSQIMTVIQGTDANGLSILHHILAKKSYYNLTNILDLVNEKEQKQIIEYTLKHPKLIDKYVLNILKDTLLVITQAKLDSKEHGFFKTLAKPSYSVIRQIRKCTTIESLREIFNEINALNVGWAKRSVPTKNM